MLCTSCGRDLRPDARFCDNCGTPAASQGSTPVTGGVTAGADPSSRSSTERRQLTVMFCDLVGSTGLSQALDPEDYQELLEAYRTTCSAVVKRYDGRVARMVGDGLLIYFGYPIAHEDDPHRAVRAGLHIIEQIQKLSDRFRQSYAQNLSVRIGLHAGLAVVGDIGEGETVERMGTVGETPNIAARIESVAAVNELVISESIHHLTEGYFECKSLGVRELKGIAEAIHLYRVTGEDSARSRLEIAASSGLTPLVGRADELGLLMDRWQQAADGDGQVVQVCGEPGIGKSRLLMALQERIADSAHATWEGRCFPHFQHSALYPIIDLFQRALKYSRSDSNESKADKLVTAVSRYLSDKDDVALLASMLSLTIAGADTYGELSPEQKKYQTLAAILDFLQRQTQETPVLLIIEDLHWIDPSTIELLQLIIEKCPKLRLMLLLSFRPEFESPWLADGHISHVTLNRMSQTEIHSMIQEITRGKTLPGELFEQVVSNTDGIPLFIEEVTKMKLDSDLLVEEDGSYTLKGDLPSSNIPSTLQGSLLARLDRLSDSKFVAQMGSVIGREFSFELLATIVPLDRTELLRALDQLVDAQLLYQQEAQPEPIYVFKHALVQEVAYDSMLKRTRRQYHQKIAEVFADPSSDFATQHPELLAHHYTEAGFAEEGLRYWKLAGMRAVEYYANIEAELHLRSGLQLIPKIDPAKQKQEELELLVALGVALTATKGYAHPDTEQLYLRTSELSRELQDPVQMFRAHSGLYRCYITGSDLHRSLEQSEALLNISKDAKDSNYVAEAERAMGATLMALGRFQESREHLENGIAVYDPDKFYRHTFETTTDPGLSCKLWLLSPLWLLGWPDQTVKRADEALELAKKRDNPFELSYAFVYRAWMNTRIRDWGQARIEAERGLEIATEHGFPIWTGAGRVFLGRALVSLGDVEGGLLSLEKGIAFYRSTGARIVISEMLYLQAEAMTLIGKVDEAAAIIDEAIEISIDHDEHTWIAELYRFKGELMSLMSQSTDSILSQYQQALDYAQAQKAKSIELRIVTSKVRLLHEAGNVGDAVTELQEVCDWFVEGASTFDQMEARALAANLA